MNIINCTIHPITIITNKGVTQTKSKIFVADPNEIEVIYEIEPSGYLPRVDITDECVSFVNKIPVHQVQYGEIQALPKSQYETIYIASRIVAVAAKALGRSDVYAPGAMVRNVNDTDVVLGCLFLQEP